MQGVKFKTETIFDNQQKQHQTKRPVFNYEATENISYIDVFNTPRNLSEIFSMVVNQEDDQVILSESIDMATLSNEQKYAA